MTGKNGNYSRNKGSRAELEVQAILRDQLGYPCRRALGAGRQDDIGDIHGLPDTVVQVANYQSLDRAVREKLPTLERQMDNADALHGALWCRRRGGQFVVVLTPELYCRLWREAQPAGREAA